MSLPAGTHCEECGPKGHFCQAVLTVDGVALCLECADEEDCSFVRSAKRFPAAPAEEDAFRGWAANFAGQEEGLAQVVKDQLAALPPAKPKPEVTWRRPEPLEEPKLRGEHCIVSRQKPRGAPFPQGRQGKRIPEEIKAAILAADPDLSNPKLARRLGVSDATVSIYRRRAGIKTAALRDHRGMAPLADSLRQQILERTARGEKIEPICAAVGVSSATVSRVRAKAAAQAALARPEQTIQVGGEQIHYTAGAVMSVEVALAEAGAGRTGGTEAAVAPERYRMTLEVTAAKLDEIWSQLPAETKARAMQSVLEGML